MNLQTIRALELKARLPEWRGGESIEGFDDRGYPVYQGMISRDDTWWMRKDWIPLGEIPYSSLPQDLPIVVTLEELLLLQDWVRADTTFGMQTTGEPALKAFLRKVLR